MLRPGDALYLPRGWIHSATALGDTSIHLTVGLSAYTRADVVDTLLGLVGDPESLRASLPLGIDVGDPDQLRPIVEETVADLVARTHLDRRPGGAGRPPPRCPVRPRHPPGAGRAAGHARRDHRADRGLHACGGAPSFGGRIETSGDRVTLTARGTVLSLPVEAAPALHALRSGDPVAVGSLPGLDLASALVVVRRLLREGVVVTSS